MKINSTSMPFQSTYIFNHKSIHSHKSQEQINDYCIKNRVNYSTKYSMTHAGFFSILNAEQTVNMPDSLDDDFEIYCANRGIRFSKINTKALLDETSIIARMEKPTFAPTDSRLALLDVDKFDEIYRTQVSSKYDLVKKSYENSHKDSVSQLLLSGNEIPTPMISITENYTGAVEDVSNKKLTDNLKYALNIDIDCEQRNIYFGLLEQGLSQFPVCVDDETYEYGLKLGVFKN